MCRKIPFRRGAVQIVAGAMLRICRAAPSILVGAGVASAGTVTHNADAGPGSLRQTIADAHPGDTITFDPTLDGHTILLTNGQITVEKSLTIDASALPGRITIDGHGTVTSNRIFSFEEDTTNSLIGITLINGYAYDDYGGAILAFAASLVISNCTISGNVADIYGGGIHRYFREMTIHNSTFSGNTAKAGGAIYNVGRLTVHNSTFSGNTAAQLGGAIFQRAWPIDINNCTITENSAGVDAGGIYVAPPYDLNLTNSIVAGNMATEWAPDLNIGLNPSHSVISEDPLLAPLGYYGGPTPTQPPLPGSPAIDRGVDTPGATDQRGFSRKVGAAVDSGAAEFQEAPDVHRYWLTDWDHDGNPFGLEFATGTDWFTPNAPDTSHLALSQTGADVDLTFGYNSAASPYAAWVVLRSLDLTTDPFVEIFRYDGPTAITTTNVPMAIQFTSDAIELRDLAIPNHANAFYSLQVLTSP